MLRSLFFAVAYAVQVNVFMIPCNGIAAFARGSAFAHFSYPTLLTMSAVVAFVFALVFRLSLGGEQSARVPMTLTATRHDLV